MIRELVPIITRIPEEQLMYLGMIGGIWIALFIFAYLK